MVLLLQRLKNRLHRRQQAQKTRQQQTRHFQARLLGTVKAWRSALSVLNTAQLLLWAALTGAAPGAGTLWQAALLLVPAGLLVHTISGRLWGQRDAHRPFELLLLLPPLLLDGAVLLHALLSLLHRLMPSYPAWLLRIVIPLLLVAGTLLGRQQGAAFGTCLWRHIPALLCAVLVWQVIAVRGTDRLFPLLGEGIPVTLGLALNGLGAVWCLSLQTAVPPACATDMRFLSGDQAVTSALPPAYKKTRSTLRSALLPPVLLAGYALCLCCAAPWTVTGGQPLGARLLWPGRSTGSVTISALGALMWMLLCMLGFPMVLSSARQIMGRVFPGMKGTALVPPVAALPALLLCFLSPEELPGLVEMLLPLRLLPWLGAALWSSIHTLIGKRKGRKGT